MKKKKMILLIVMIGALFLDQWTKLYIASHMRLLESISVIPDFFSITYAHNTGAAWSMLEGQMWFFYVVTILVLIMLVPFYRSLKEHQFISKLGIAMIFAGTLGNFIDRIRLGYVVDFLDFIIFGYDFPIFNVADVCLCVGIGLVILDEFLYENGVVLWKKKDIQ